MEREKSLTARVRFRPGSKPNLTVLSSFDSVHNVDSRILFQFEFFWLDSFL